MLHPSPRPAGVPLTFSRPDSVSSHGAGDSHDTHGFSESRKAGASSVSRRMAFATAGAGLALVLAACSSEDDSLARQASEGGNKGYVAGDGSVAEYAPGERGEPVTFEAPMYDGAITSAEDLRGKPALLNFWYAGCAPCRAEAPELVSLHKDFGKEVRFLGVNLRDQQATAEAFERNFSIPYPSATDQGGEVLLALSKYVPPQAVPTTLILDKEGRVAARILGQADHATLKALLKDAVAEV